MQRGCTPRATEQCLQGSEKLQKVKGEKEQQVEQASGGRQQQQASPTSSCDSDAPGEAQTEEVKMEDEAELAAAAARVATMGIIWTDI